MDDYKEKDLSGVVYDYGYGLYVNLTNKCPCHCDFCIRDMTDSLGTADSLWLKEDPSYDDVIEAINLWPLSKYQELVFCGYGEPTERLDLMLDIATYVKKNTSLLTRVNTNGLSDLINGKFTPPMFEGLVDCVSVSLNQCTAEKYVELCHPKFGLESFDAILKFTKDIKEYVPDVRMSIVNVINENDVIKCEQIAESFGIKLRIR